MIDDHTDAISRGSPSKGGTDAVLCAEQQTNVVKREPCVLAINLMEQICERANLNQAYKRVKANKGAPGVDGMTIDTMKEFLRNNKEQLIESLLDGSYKPQAVRKVMIPKPCGGERQLGIPTVIDRLVQQAIQQVLVPVFDKGFSESSYGFRPNRSAHNALKRAKSYVEEGNTFVVDMDLEKFFDRVNHDILMSRLARRIGDKHLLRIIRRFLTAGIMQDGVVMSRHEGTPQGGPLSPLLSNILLDELDKELERRGHKFCRYADDQNIYVRSQRAGERVYASVKKFIETKLKLQVNDKKSAVALVSERKFLGYRLTTDGRLTIAPLSQKRVKEKIRQLTGRNRGRNFNGVIRELNMYLRGWISYFRLAQNKQLLKELDGWIRRRLRCYRLKQCKHNSTMFAYLLKQRVSPAKNWLVYFRQCSWWGLSRSEAANRSLNRAWFKKQGLVSLLERWEKLLPT